MGNFMSWAKIYWRLVNIQQFSVEENRVNTQDHKYKCIFCNEDLVAHVGQKKNWHFSHIVDKGCVGGNYRLAQLLSVRKFLSLVSYYVPSTYFLFKENEYKIENEFDISLQDNIHTQVNLTSKIKPDIWIENEDEARLVCLEFHTLSEKELNQYRCYINNNLDKRIYVLEMDVQKVVDKLNSNSVISDIEEALNNFQEFISSRVVISTALVKKDLMIEASKHICNNEEILCPASNNKYVVSKSECNKCKFCVSTERGVTCYGKTCLLSPREIIDVANRLDVTYKDLVNSKSYLYDELRDRNSNLISDLKTLYKVKNDKSIIGNCKICNSSLKLAVGKYGITYGGITRLNTENNEYLFRYCPKCQAVEPVYCPYCGSPTKLIKNRDGRLFIKCDNYLSKSDKENGRTLPHECDFTLTVYDNEAGTYFSDEIIAVGGLDKLESSSKKKIKRKLLKCRKKV